MDREPLLTALLEFFLGETDAPGLSGSVPGSYPERRRLLRALMNVRPPRPVPEDILALQDELLGLERDEKGVVRVAGLPTIRDREPATNLAHAERLCLWQGDITRLDTDAVVNAANSGMLGCFIPLHACIDNVIHSAAGVQLRLACEALMRRDFPDGRWAEPTGRARVTPAFNLPSRRVIHTVGPIVDGALNGRHRELLAACYRSCLDAAAGEGLASLAVCCISTGEFHFPKAEAARIALGTVTAWLDSHPGTLDRVVFDVYTEEDHALYQSLL